MKEKEIFEKVIKSLIKQGYKIDPNSITYNDINEDTDTLSKRIRLGIDAINILAKIFDIDFEPEIKSSFKYDKFQEDLKKIYPITNYVFFKYILSQPIIVALVKADELTSTDFKNITTEYDKLMLQFREHTGKMFGTKLSVTGLILFVFSDSSKATEFETKYQEENKIWHFWKKTWTITWAIDIEKSKIIKHRKLPILIGSIIDPKKMEADIFG